MSVEALREEQSKDQKVTNVKLMLDRQFEQSIERGLNDAKDKIKNEDGS
jgi:hypothetical protein